MHSELMKAPGYPHTWAATHVVHVGKLDLQGCEQRSRWGLHSHGDDLRVEDSCVPGGHQSNKGCQRCGVALSQPCSAAPVSGSTLRTAPTPPHTTMPSLPISYWSPVGAQAIPFPSHPPLQGQEAAQVSVEHGTNHEHR